MIVERAMNEQFLSNTYLVADDEGGQAFFVDAGGPIKPLIEAAERLRLEPSHVLLTHHHFDHVSELDAIRARWPDIEVLIDPLELELMGDGAAGTKEESEQAIGQIKAGEELRFGTLGVRPLHTPGHTRGMLSFLVSDGRERSTSGSGGGAGVFTGDTLFRGSVGGVRAPGHTTYMDLKDSIMGTLMELPPQTTIYPGHSDFTTVASEWDHNSFIRVWRGLDPEGSSRCLALGEPATLILLGDDYDGGKKAWVRWRDGSDDIVPGSQIQEAGG